METKQSRISLAIVIAAILVGGTIYYVLGSDSKTSVTTVSQKNIALTQTSQEYAVMGRELWSAFECASWASIQEDDKEEERLFMIGYERGKTFLAAVEAGKITKEDSSQNIPIVVLLMLNGPTPDFILGRMFEASQENALDEVFKTGDQYNDKDMQKIIAGSKFRDGNCQLIK